MRTWNCTSTMKAHAQATTKAHPQTAMKAHTQTTTKAHAQTTTLKAGIITKKKMARKSHPDLFEFIEVIQAAAEVTIEQLSGADGRVRAKKRKVVHGT